MKFNRILVITDNPYLELKFREIISQKDYNKFNFSFAVSPFSDLNDFESSTKQYDLKIKEHIQIIIHSYDLVFSLHCKQFFPPELILNVKCINIHPGYNPLNRGWYPQVFSIIHDLPIGATIHEIDNKLDHGPIIDREFVQKYIYDTSESLYNRVLDMEIQLLKKNLLPILKNDYSILIPEEEGNLFLKKDFNNLLEIDLNKEYKAIDLINILRALTHGKYSNAFYYNKSNGRKIFISINLHEE